MRELRLVWALVLPVLATALSPLITVRRLDSTSTSEWCAAAAVRAAAFLDEDVDRATLEHKVRLITT
jgi:hypothetical protein